jgi:hypothetical protein
LSYWGFSVHDVFSAFPSEFIPLAIARTSGAGALTFADGTVFVPYILACGDLLSSVKCCDGVVDATTNATMATQIQPMDAWMHGEMQERGLL